MDEDEVDFANIVIDATANENENQIQNEAVQNNEEIIDHQPNFEIQEPQVIENILVENEIQENEENFVPDPQVAGEGGWNPDALMEDLTWEKVKIYTHMPLLLKAFIS